MTVNCVTIIFRRMLFRYKILKYTKKIERDISQTKESGDRFKFSS